MVEYFPGYVDWVTCLRRRVCSSMAGYFTGKDTSLYSSLLVMLWTVCVERPCKIHGTFLRKYPSVFEISRMRDFRRNGYRGRVSPYLWKYSALKLGCKNVNRGGGDQFDSPAFC